MVDVTMELGSSLICNEDSDQEVYEAPTVDPKPMMDVLLDCSWRQSEKQISQGAERYFYKNQPPTFLEENHLQGWLTSLPISDQSQLRQTINSDSKKRKSLYNSPDYEDYNMFRRKSQYSLPDYHHRGVLWRSIVEADTYRYVVNNGCYRYLKTNAVHGKDAKYQKRASTFISPAILRKEIAQDLRHIIEGETQIAHGKIKVPQSQTNNRATDKSSCRSISGRNSQNDSPTVSDAEANCTEEAKHNLLTELVQEYKPHAHPMSESPFQLPSVDVPLLSKAFAERLMENFSSKISALEDEIRHDAKKKILQKSTEEISKLRRSSLQDFLLSDSVMLKHSDPPSSAKTTERRLTFPQSTFQVISVYKPEEKKPLKPLEKVTPTMRQTEDTHKMQMAHLRYNSVKGNDNNATRYSFSDSVINPIHLTENTSNDKPQSVPPDLLSKDKILSVNNIAIFSTIKTGDAPLSSRGPFRANVLPNGKKIHLQTRVRNTKTNEMGDKGADSVHSAPMGKPKEKDMKKSDVETDNISEAKYLPQLLGKKLPVSVSAQKWL